jgi:hypothetical protein
MKSRTGRVALLTGLMLSTAVALACKTPAPQAVPTIIPAGTSCPSNYSHSGNTCAPSSGARYFFVLSSSQSCPSNYAQEGRLCIADHNACYAYDAAGQSCPSGYGSSGRVCTSD